MRETFLPFALRDIDDTEFDEIKESLASGWVTTGPKTRRFEAEFAAAVGARHAIAVNSCTAAMHLALEAIGLRRGDIEHGLRPVEPEHVRMITQALGVE